MYLDIKNTLEYREQLARLDAKYPGKETLTIAEATQTVKINRQTLLKDPTFPAKKLGSRNKYGGVYIVPKTALAKWLLTV